MAPCHDLILRARGDWLERDLVHIGPGLVSFLDWMLFLWVVGDFCWGCEILESWLSLPEFA